MQMKSFIFITMQIQHQQFSFSPPHPVVFFADQAILVLDQFWTRTSQSEHSQCVSSGFEKHRISRGKPHHFQSATSHSPEKLDVHVWMSALLSPASHCIKINEVNFHVTQQCCSIAISAQDGVAAAQCNWS